MSPSSRWTPEIFLRLPIDDLHHVLNYSFCFHWGIQLQSWQQSRSQSPFCCQLCSPRSKNRFPILHMRKHYFVLNKNATPSFVWRTALWFNASASCRIRLCRISQEMLCFQWATDVYHISVTIQALPTQQTWHLWPSLTTLNIPKIVDPNVTKHQLFSFPTSLFNWNTACTQCRVIAYNMAKKIRNVRKEQAQTIRINRHRP